MRFVLGRQLGAGAFGEVFEAVDASSGAAVAVKRLWVRRSTARGAGAARSRCLRVRHAPQRPHHLALCRAISGCGSGGGGGGGCCGAGPSAPGAHPCRRSASRVTDGRRDGECRWCRWRWQ